MLEKYFVKPQTVDRVRACWIGAEIERYVEWLCAREYADRTVWHRVPVLVEFGEFARACGADTLLPRVFSGTVSINPYGVPSGVYLMDNSCALYGLK